jgi:hypothetical protein
MSWVRVAVLVLLGFAIGVGAVLLVEGNPAVVSVHVGWFAAHADLSLWLVIAFSFLSGTITAGILAATARLDGPLFHVLVGSLFALVLCGVGAILGTGGAAGVALLVGLLLLVIATAYERRINIANAARGFGTGSQAIWNGLSWALGATHKELTDWIQGLMHNPPGIAPPPSGIILVFVILLAPVVMGSTILLRAALVLALAAAGIVSVLRALALVRGGQPIELRARSGGLGSSQGGWRLSQPGSLLLIAAVVLGAAIGLAQVDRRTEAPSSAGTAPQRETEAGRVEAGKNLEARPSGAAPAAAQH